MIGDGSKDYDYEDNTKSRLTTGCKANIRGSDNVLKARLFIQSNFLAVEFNEKNSEEWKLCFTVNLNKTDIIPTSGYVGFSGMTGDAVDTHSIHSVTIQPHVYNDEDAHVYKEQPMHHSILWWLGMMVFFGALVVVIIAFRSTPSGPKL